MRVAGRALIHNLGQLGPLVLPLGEQLRFLINMLARQVLNMDLEPYTPSFDGAFDHFCIHTGKAMLEKSSLKMGSP